MIRTALTAVAIVVGVTAVGAQSDPIAERKAIMKKVGDDTKGGAAMLRGEPFDLAKAQALMALYADAAVKMPTLFPASSKTGGETTAGPKIWEEQDKFSAAWKAWGDRATESKDKIKDLASFRTAFAATARDCQGCHDVYRVKK